MKRSPAMKTWFHGFFFYFFVKMPFERDHHQWRIEEMKRRKEKDLTYSNSVAFSS
jgi:hypothetical protein